MSNWSSSDFPYQCLIDVERTAALDAAIAASVRPGDVVLDAGAGSGILSFFAARAGARKVHAVEVDEHLARCLSRSVRASGLEHVIEVVHGDLHSVHLPRNVDVVVCEMMETGLLDERQVSALRALRERGVIGPETCLIPRRYQTFVELGRSSFEFYGQQLLIPKHDWPHYARSDGGWLTTEFSAVSTRGCVASLDFREPIAPEVDVTLVLSTPESALVNAVRLSACVTLTDGVVLAATNALNGNKVLPLDSLRVTGGQRLSARVRYRMGGGLGSFSVEVESA